MSSASLRHLVLVLGDQLDRDSAAFDGFDAQCDAAWMAENEEEATHVWCHKLRLAFFFSAMRHFRDELRDRQVDVHYHALGRRRSDDAGRNFAEILAKTLRNTKPERLIVLEPGDLRVRRMLEHAACDLDVALEIRSDRHFYCTADEFREWAEGRRNLLLETFYRHMRRKHDVLLRKDGTPEGGEWNFDNENRASFGADGPPMDDYKAPRRFSNDAIDEAVCEMVSARFGDHPGTLEHFDIPRTRDQARAYLREFVDRRLPLFGRYEDAMWAGEEFLWHSRLSAALNVKLLSPQECIEAVLKAYEAGDAPLNSVEGFVRQILGWREFIRGVYWLHAETYGGLNALECEDRDVPHFFWTGETQMNCVANAMASVIHHGYSHHILRLMVLGQFALLLGVHPYRFHEWHMAMYLDAIDWVSLPNALGMSQYGDAGIVGTKPYCASGNYIHRMSNYCRDCRYRYDRAAGEQACPFTTLYYDFLDRHRKRFSDNRRMNFQMRNLGRKSASDLKAIRSRARQLRERIDARESV